MEADLGSGNELECERFFKKLSAIIVAIVMSEFFYSRPLIGLKFCRFCQRVEGAAIAARSGVDSPGIRTGSRTAGRRDR